MLWLRRVYDFPLNGRQIFKRIVLLDFLSFFKVQVLLRVLRLLDFLYSIRNKIDIHGFPKMYIFGSFRKSNFLVF